MQFALAIASSACTPSHAPRARHSHSASTAPAHSSSGTPGAPTSILRDTIPGHTAASATRAWAVSKSSSSTCGSNGVVRPRATAAALSSCPGPTTWSTPASWSGARAFPQQRNVRTCHLGTRQPAVSRFIELMASTMEALMGSLVGDDSSVPSLTRKGARTVSEPLAGQAALAYPSSFHTPPAGNKQARKRTLALVPWARSGGRLPCRAKEAMEGKDPYKVLGVSPSASTAEVKAAFRNLGAEVGTVARGSDSCQMRGFQASFPLVSSSRPRSEAAPPRPQSGRKGGIGGSILCAEQ